MVSRIEGVGPMQYGTKGLLGPNFTDIEEKYDLTEAQDGFGEEGEADAHASDEEAGLGLLGEEDADASDEESDDEDADASDEQTDDDASGMFDDSSEAY
jgi:hypothetical protein